MYEVKIYDGHEDKEGIVIQSPYINGLKVSENSKVTQKTIGIPDFRFAINIQNPGWNRIKPLRTLIRVKNVTTGKEEFAGRILKPTQIMTVRGLATIQYESEGFLAYLQDSNQRHGEYRNITPRQFLQVIIDNHNRQVEPHKRIALGEVNVTNTTDNVYRYLGYEKTFPTIQDKLVDRLGGYLKLREESDGFYLDYLANVGEFKNEPIRLGRNLKEMRREVDPTNVITRLLPLGARIESDDPEAIDTSQARVTIESMNGGNDYIDDRYLIAEFGIIEGEIVFDDVNTPSILKTRGEQFIASQKAAKLSYQITPVDLSSLDQSLESFEVDNYYPIVNQLFDINETLQVIRKIIYVSKVNDIELVIGEQYRTLTQYQVEANKRSKQVVELQNTVDGQGKTITAIRNEVVNVEGNLDNLQRVIESADLEELPEAIGALEQAINDLNGALDGIPIYDVATHTKDGLMASVDKVKLDGLRNYAEATEMSAGLMSASDKQKMNRLTITQSINLDKLFQDVQDLKNS